jgi:Fe-S cluster biosynthesis and repair protein YggX
LAQPPIPGDLGKQIYDCVSQQAWNEWLNYQTMLINENRLNMVEQSARSYLRQQLEYYFFPNKK